MERADKNYFFDLEQLATTFPDHSASRLLDIRMVNAPNASCRLVKLYQQLPLHFHKVSDESIYVFSGKALFQVGEEKCIVSKGMFIHFERAVPHAVLEIMEAPFLTLVVDAPCRPESDVTFVQQAS